MKIAYQWLRQHIDCTHSVEEIATLLTSIGLEVEAIESFETIKGGLKGIIVGQVVSCKQHPNADRLRITQVAINTDEPLQIICGAPNVATGQKVAVATIGTILYDKDGNAFEIKKSKIRGEESYGMICAEDELGLSTNHEGIMILSADTIIGTPLSEILKLTHDFCLEIGLTPNRADAMGHYGVARDLKAVIHQQKGKATLHKKFFTPLTFGTERLNITIENTAKTPRYTALRINRVQVKPSPDWIQNRLKSIGLNPVNNIVDITNYIMHDLGQPMHAFDAQKITENTLIIRQAKQDEVLQTLDKINRKLTPDDLIIADAQKPLCIAGVMGGLESGVSTETTDIILESAYFDAVSIRKTAKRYSINTDSSFRFERGTDPNMCLNALYKAAQLIVEIAGGTITTSVFDHYPKPIQAFNVALNYNRIQQLLGIKIPKETIENILELLEIEILSENNDLYQLAIPPYRVDVQREADVMEEILRIYGYNNILNPEKLSMAIIPQPLFNPYKEWTKWANHLASLGFHEIMNNALQKASYNSLSTTINANETVLLLNPLSQDLNAMRQSLLWGGLEVLAYNNNRKQSNLRLFELGKTYHKTAETYQEKQQIGIWIMGNKTLENWQNLPQSSNFYYAKGLLDHLLQKFGLKNFQYTPTTQSIFSEGLDLQINKNTIAHLGYVKKDILKKIDLNQAVIYIDIQWDNILKLVQDVPKSTFVELPKYPSARKDLALVIDKTIKYQDLYTIALQTEKKILKSINLFDVYEGDKIPENKKSYALSFELQDETRTLDDKTIEKTMQKLIVAFERETGAVLRS